MSALPRRSDRLATWFTGVAERTVRRSFHAVRVSGEPPVAAAGPLIVYLNHPSWWDPLAALILARRQVAWRTPYAPIDAAQLARYPFFGRLGFFGVEQGTARGARAFLRAAEAICAQPAAALWLTAEGTFRDPRRRPTELASGLAHLAARLSAGRIVPLAIELCFWSEKQPELLARWGEPVAVAGGPNSTDSWRELLARRLEAELDALASDAQSREASRFTTLLEGRAGLGGVYDAYRAARARLRGERFDPRHGAEP